MCGRFAVTLPPDAVAQWFDAASSNDLPDTPNYNICPTNQVAVVLPGSQRRLVPMRWGFLPHWYKSETDGPLLINARSETIAEKPAFRNACRERRCLIPANGFYEWTKTEDGKREPWFIHGAAPIVFAGVWQNWGPDGIRTCAIVTCGANPKMAQIHHRMPVILGPEDWALWLGETPGKAAPLMQAAPEDALDFFRVNPAVNSNRASGSELIEPL